MTSPPERQPDWTLGTWKGSRLQQHRAFHALPFARKLELVEELCDFAREFTQAATTKPVADGAEPDGGAKQRRR